MPQNAVHGLMGLAVAGWLVPRSTRGEADAGKRPQLATPLALGLILGSMLPDIDMYPTSISFLLGNAGAATSLHRTYSHGLLAFLVMAAVALCYRGAQPTRYLLHGLAFGWAGHELLDFFFWFAPLDFFWPLSHLPPAHPVLPVIDLWEGVRLPALLGNPDAYLNLREAGEPAFFWLYLLALQRIGATQGLKRGSLKIVATACWLCFLMALTAVPMLPNSKEVMLVMFPGLLVFMPFSWWQTFSLREEIGRWCLGRTEPPQSRI